MCPATSGAPSLEGSVEPTTLVRRTPRHAATSFAQALEFLRNTMDVAVTGAKAKGIDTDVAAFPVTFVKQGGSNAASPVR